MFVALSLVLKYSGGDDGGVKLLDLDKCFYHPNRSYSQIHKLAI